MYPAWLTEYTFGKQLSSPTGFLVLSAFLQVWTVAAKAANDETETQRQTLEAMRREMEQDRVDMTAEIERLETALDEATNQTEK